VKHLNETQQDQIETEKFGSNEKSVESGLDKTRSGVKVGCVKSFLKRLLVHIFKNSKLRPVKKRDKINCPITAKVRCELVGGKNRLVLINSHLFK
jgi:hypothetical protein